ncbi:MAG TPA: hypothetical protein VNP96_05040 [Solirubrobacterales bacterium]|nr:hypothetical protein [Solirubrobacterales bacterium]
MAGVTETAKLVEGIVRLRRAERVPAAAEEVAPVRRDLEARVGPTLSRSRASRVLGISQTALDRWVRRGQIPTVVTPRGRREVPLAFVVELAEVIRGLRSEGETRHPLAVALAKRSNAAEQVDTSPMRTSAEGRAPLGHLTAERRSLAYHRAVADRLDDRVLSDARARVDRLADGGHMHPRYADRWREILALPTDTVAERIVEDDQEGRDLRQNSPFAGVLNEQERRRIIERVR